MNFKKAVKKIKKLVRESENPFINDCVWLHCTDNLQGAREFTVEFYGETKDGETVTFKAFINNEMTASERWYRWQDIRVMLLECNGFDDLLSRYLPDLDSEYVNFHKVWEEDRDRDVVSGVSWSIDNRTGQACNLSTSFLVRYFGLQGKRKQRSLDFFTSAPKPQNEEKKQGEVL